MKTYGPAEIADLQESFFSRLAPPRGGLDSSGGGPSGERPAPDLSAAAVEDRLKRSAAFLRGFIRREFGDDPSLVELAEKLLKDGREGLELLGGRRDQAGASAQEIRSGLEAVVRTDGSRPAYLVREDRILEDSAPASDWADRIEDPLRAEAVHEALRCVGRIDTDDPLRPYVGTGWLAVPDLIFTNRHVAELIVEFDAPEGPRLKTEINPRIDFGHEFGGASSRAPRKITDLLFAGPHHTRAQTNPPPLDIAVFRLEKAAAGETRKPLALGTAPQFAAPGLQVLVAGYPAQPDPSLMEAGLLSDVERIFARLWGYKRLAPGEIMDRPWGPRALAHDASTLGGNSGSLVMALDAPGAAAAIHYGGVWRGERCNLAHGMGAAIGEPGLAGLAYESLAALCAAEGVELRV